MRELCVPKIDGSGITAAAACSTNSIKMKLDAELMFECLIYLNVYYFAVFATCESIMTAAKYRSVIYTPKIERDASVVFAILFAEISKILLYRRFKDERRGIDIIVWWWIWRWFYLKYLISDLITAIAALLTLVTIAGMLYTFFIQCPVLKLEYILCSLMIMLAGTEIIFGVLQLLPCCKKVQYY